MGTNTSCMLKVSVIMATYNRAHMVTKAIESFLQQGYENAELVILNNGSTDNTKLVLEKCSDNSRIKIWHLSKNTIHAANISWELSDGDLICQLHDDDELTPTSIADRVLLFKMKPETQVVYGGVIEQYLYGTPIRTISGQAPDRKRIITDEYINFTTMMWRRELPFRFDMEIPYCADWLFKIRCLNECNVASIAEPVMHYTIHAGQESVRLRGTGAEEEKIMREKIKLLGYGN